MYRAVSVVALPLASLYLMWRSRRQPAYRQFWDERFAWSSFPLKTGRPRVWIHAVSVGETNAAKPLLEAVLERWPECDVLLTHMTPTGREAGAKLVALAPDRIHQCYLPYDAPYAVEKFFRQTQPTIGIIMETEVWPNLMSEAKRCGVPMVLANARESEKSRAQAEKFLDVMGPAFGSFTAILAQSEEDKERLESLGGRNVTVCGSVKFDIRPRPPRVPGRRRSAAPSRSSPRPVRARRCCLRRPWPPVPNFSGVRSSGWCRVIRSASTRSSARSPAQASRSAAARRLRSPPTCPPTPTSCSATAWAK